MFSQKRKTNEAITAVEVKKIEIKKADEKDIPQQWKQGPDVTRLIVNSISKYKDAASLAETCRFLYHGTKDSLHARKLKELAHYIVIEPNEEKVKALLTQNPELITVVFNETTDTYGRKLIKNTIFQLAYGAGDDAMCLVLKPFFIQVHGSEEAAIKEMEIQRAAKFAEDKKADQNARDHLAAILQPAIAAITAEQFNLGNDADGKLILSSATLAAIETFREAFAQSQPRVIQKGMHFRLNTLLVETYNAYAVTATQWGYRYNRCALFEDGILSCVLLAVPANDAQKFGQGLYYLQERHEPFGRSLALRVGKNNFYRECRADSRVFSMAGTCVDIYSGAARTRAATATPRPGSSALSNLMYNKNVKLAELMRSSSHARQRLGV